MAASKRERLLEAQRDFSASSNDEQKKRIFVGRSDFREVRNPEPVETETRGIIHWGKENLYPQELVSMRQDNPTHGGIINQKVTYITAAGVEIVGPQEFIDTLTPMMPDIAGDLKTFNGFCLLFSRPNADSTEWKVKFIDFETVRFTNRDYVFAISDDWSVGSQSKEKTNYKEVLDINCVLYSTDLEFVLYARIKPKQRKLKGRKVSLCYYPIPEYSGAITSILAGTEHDYFTYAEAVNGYKGGTIICLNNGQPDTPEEADEIADDIKKEATDRDKQGGIVILWSDGKDNAPTIENLNGNDLDKRYVEANKEIRTKIMTGHSVLSPTLFGISSDAMFGSKDEMETAYTLYANNQVVKDQKFISESIEWAFARISIPMEIKFKKYVLALEQEASDDNKVLRQLNSMSPLVATKVLESMTPDEIRALAKLLPKGNDEIPAQEVQAAFSVAIMRYKLKDAGFKDARAMREALSHKGTQSEIASALANMFLLHKLSSCGVKRSERNVIKSRAFDYVATDEDFMNEFGAFADGLTKVQVKILKLISEGKTFNEVSKAIGKGALGLSLEIAKLQIAGHLNGWKVNDKSNPTTEVRYSYEVKAGLGPAIIPTTRDFCREVIELDRLYTRAEIDTLSNELDMDVWRYRGGWYHNPGTGRTTPSCRHEWKQNIVRA
jgi:hypothetical protein